MNIKEALLRRIAALPDDCDWPDVFRAVNDAHADHVSRPKRVRELQAPYGAQAPADEHHSGEEAAVGNDYDVIIERDTEGFYVASVPALRGCHTQGRSMEQVLDRVREAIELCLEVAGGRPADTGFVGVRRVSVAAG